MNESNIATHFAEHQKVVKQSLKVLQVVAEQVSNKLIEALEGDRKVIAFGNGGSATQASHLVGELMGRFAQTRQPFPAIALAGDQGTVTCISNDFGYEMLFERQVAALAQPGDVAIGLTTSGRSVNVLRGLAMARMRDAVTVALTGSAGLVDAAAADYVLAVPSASTANIQEIHLMLIHAWCIGIDEKLGAFDI